MSVRRGFGGAALAGVLCVVAVLFVLAKTAPAKWARDVVLPPDPLEITFDADFSPRALPRTERAAIAFAFAFAAKIRTGDGSRPPALKELLLELDRDSSIDATAVPRCELSGRDRGRTLAEIKRACKDAIIGGGEAGFEVAFPELASVESTRDLVVVNGHTKGGGATFYAIGRMPAPLSGTIVMPIEIRKNRRGPVGAEATIAVPVVAGGAGSLTDLSLALHRRIGGRSPTAGVMSLKCPDRRFLLEIRAIFADGAVVQGDLPRRCVPRTQS